MEGEGKREEGGEREEREKRRRKERGGRRGKRENKLKTEEKGCMEKGRKERESKSCCSFSCREWVLGPVFLCGSMSSSSSRDPSATGSGHRLRNECAAALHHRPDKFEADSRLGVGVALALLKPLPPPLPPPLPAPAWCAITAAAVGLLREEEVEEEEARCCFMRFRQEGVRERSELEETTSSTTCCGGEERDGN